MALLTGEARASQYPKPQLLEGVAPKPTGFAAPEKNNRLVKTAFCSGSGDTARLSAS